MPISDNDDIGLFLPSTYIWDVTQLNDIDVNSPDFKELLVRLYQNINSMLIALNLKDSGYYDLTEFVNSQQFFPNPALTDTTPKSPEYRQVYRKVIDFGALPNTGLKSVAHGIVIGTPTTFSFTRIYATATSQTGSSFIPIPYASSTLANNIELDVDAINVNITTAANLSNYTICYVVLEYIKE